MRMCEDKLKIFVSAYACEPGKGSEIGVGWHWVLEMSKYFDLWVMTRANNQKPIEDYFRENPEEANGIHWVYFDCPNYIKRFKHQMTGVRTYYTIWQHMANKVVKDVMEANEIPIFHLLTYGNAIWDIARMDKRNFLYGVRQVALIRLQGSSPSIMRGNTECLKLFEGLLYQV